MQVDRDEGVALFLDLADQFVDFFPVQQAATHADGVRTYVGGRAVERADIGADQPDLTADDADVGLLDAHPAGARFNGQSCMIIGHQKGRDTKEKIHRNFGMPRPEGYRKAMRLMRLAEKFNLPVFTFVDTPGAYPGIDAEERGQSEAIGHNLFVMAELKVPLICTIIGEGGSGGALAIAVGDQLLMLQYSTYSVISPEGCASILWKSAERASDAAETMGITASRLKSLGLIDKVVNEPVGGAHRDHRAMAQNLKRALQDALRQVSELSPSELLERRFERLMSYGKFKEIAVD